jgi:hypothetical protein
MFFSFSICKAGCEVWSGGFLRSVYLWSSHCLLWLTRSYYLTLVVNHFIQFMLSRGKRLETFLTFMKQLWHSVGQESIFWHWLVSWRPGVVCSLCTCLLGILTAPAHTYSWVRALTSK